MPPACSVKELIKHLEKCQGIEETLKIRNETTVSTVRWLLNKLFDLIFEVCVQLGVEKLGIDQRDKDNIGQLLGKVLPHLLKELEFCIHFSSPRRIKSHIFRKRSATQFLYDFDFLGGVFVNGETLHSILHNNNVESIMERLDILIFEMKSYSKEREQYEDDEPSYMTDDSELDEAEDVPESHIWFKTED